MSQPVADTTELRQQVIAICRRLVERDQFLGTWGNVGVRVADGLLVTPTRLDYVQMQPADLVVVSWDGGRLRGERLPSSEMHLHRVILRRRLDLGALLHTHSPWASVVACAQRSLPVISEDMAQILGGEVRCSRYVPAGQHLGMAEAADAALGDGSNAVLLANHGVVVGGRDLEEAFVASLVLEKAAMAFVLGVGLGGTPGIPPQLAQQERERYLHRYGSAKDYVGTHNSLDDSQK